MHLLFVTSLVPDGEPMTGYEIANAAIIEGLRKAGARVTVMGFTWPGKRPSDPDNTIVLGEVDVRTDTAGLTQKLLWLRRAVAAGLTVSSVKLRVISEARLCDAIRQVGAFDAYVLNGVALAGAFEHVFSDKPAIFVAHNVEYRSARENSDAATSFVQKALFAREAKLLRGLETRLCAKADFVFTLAEDDGRTFGLPPERFAALPLVTRKEITPRAVPSMTHDLGLIGTWTWQPNRIGLEWFLREVRPLIDPTFRIAVAGGTPADLKSAWAGVDFVGKVPDAAAFVEGSGVVPLVSRAGTGVQLKTIETFELGMPSVATSRSVRGIAAVPANCIVADEPAAFAAAVNAMVARARRGDPQRLDGKAFHAGQVQKLDAAIRLGLDRLDSANWKAAG
ncbi:glycosyltransferase family 4 protein [Phyllobacterium leguminum]|uniref:Glycosyl transferase family 1 n=1 Tax=Phyllobacterium leguminum TaxID=314237 RepID=A0A318T5G4_9HYPH|nr:glycosyltransferase family 4 protein [Phyllobacterium leguminum]PYE90338.1 glycosyl transferase family 1 [Phyllobacterium leguminum]